MNKLLRTLLLVLTVVAAPGIASAANITVYVYGQYDTIGTTSLQIHNGASLVTGAGPEQPRLW